MDAAGPPRQLAHRSVDVTELDHWGRFYTRGTVVLRYEPPNK